MTLAKMESRLILMIWLACQCSKYTTSAQGCDQANCIPVVNGKMCNSDDLQSCCLAQCTFKHFGNARATYNILAITFNSATDCDMFFESVPEGYSTARVTTSSFGTTCPVHGTCHLYQCSNVVVEGIEQVFINEDYISTVQTVISSQSPSAAFSTNSSGTQLTSTHFLVQSPPTTKQTNTLLPVFFFPSANSLSHIQSLLTATVSGIPPPTLSNSDRMLQLYAMLGGILAVGLLCTILLVLTITYLGLLRRRGPRIRDKSRFVESHNDKQVEDSQKEQHTSADSHHLEVLPMTSNGHVSIQSTTESLHKKLVSKGCSDPSWSFQPDARDTFTSGYADSGQAFLASTNSINKPDRTVGVTVFHPVTPKPRPPSHHLYEDVDLDQVKEKAFLEQSQEGTKVPQKKRSSTKPKSPKKIMHMDEDLGNTGIWMLPNNCYKSIDVITASERIFREKNRAYLSSLSCEQVLRLLECLCLDVYKPVFQQGRISGELLVRFDEQILEEGMGIESIPDRIKFMKLITGQYSAEKLLF